MKYNVVATVDLDSLVSIARKFPSFLEQEPRLQVRGFHNGIEITLDSLEEINPYVRAMIAEQDNKP